MRNGSPSEMKEVLDGNDLLDIGFPEGPELGLALSIINEQFDHLQKHEKRALLEKLLKDPESFTEHEKLAPLAQEIIEPDEQPADEIPLREEPVDYHIFGEQFIESGALQQMKLAVRLPIAEKGALMPDAHQGYGLPIGGVLATRGTIIPYAVGVDIGCRMCMTLYDIPIDHLQRKTGQLRQILKENTRFGRAAFDDPFDDEVLHRDEFDEIPFLRSVRGRAREQIGSSGGGNHFVEFVEVELNEREVQIGLEPGNYFGLLSHSGSRGFGAMISRHYTDLAKKKCRVVDEASKLSWFDLDSELGTEYWKAMNLAGDYASANHHHIHRRIGKALGEEHLLMLENHHNFAWKEQDPEGNEWMVHRKGATPAQNGVIGIIPGSMTKPGFIVRGKGNEASINSCSHGAGRVMSRRQAKRELSQTEFDEKLAEAGVELIGSDLDEAPMVYKDIHKVMELQSDLVETIGTFTPKIVRME